ADAGMESKGVIEKCIGEKDVSLPACWQWSWSSRRAEYLCSRMRQMIRLIRPDSANIIRNIQMIAAMMKRQGLRARMNVISAAVMLLTGRRRTRTVPVRIQDQKMEKTRKIRQKTQHQ